MLQKIVENSALEGGGVSFDVEFAGVERHQRFNK
jgi:hypothetical protein